MLDKTDFDWTPESVRKLQILLGEGLSASRIAEKLGGLSRSAVLGKLHRLGLSGDHPTVWTKESTARLVALWCEGESQGRIAIALGIGRNTVMGKVRRMGLAETHPRARPRPISTQPRHSSAQGLTRAERVVRQRAIQIVRQAQPIEQPCDEAPAEFLGLTFDQRDRGRCHYPRGEGADMRFCGQPVKRQSYCGHCYRICYQPSNYQRARHPMPFSNRETQNSSLPGTRESAA